jgi:hypothetical protein
MAASFKTPARALDDGDAELVVVMRVVERISALRWRLDRIHRPTCVEVDILAGFSFCTKTPGTLSARRPKSSRFNRSDVELTQNWQSFALDCEPGAYGRGGSILIRAC